MSVKSTLLLAVVLTFFPVAPRGQTSQKKEENTPTITFCEMVEHPELYFEKKIRITATFEIRTEGSTLNDSLCPRSHDDQIGVSAVRIDETQIRLFNRDFERIRAGRKGVRPRVTAVGILRNVSRKSFDSYRYRFDVIRFESIHQETLGTTAAFNGTLRLGQSSSEKIPSVDFCEIVKNPPRYFNQTVIINAKWQSGDEFSYLTDDRCGPKSRYEIAVGFDLRQPLSEEIRASVQKIQSHEYGGRANIRAVGILRNPGKYHGYFRYRFEILKIEDVDHVVVPYQGTLDPGKTYRARMRGDKDFGLSLVPSLVIPNAHFATRIEWMNLSDFPELEKLRENSGERQIVFSVLADHIQQMTAQRWNREFECKIIRVE